MPSLDSGTQSNAVTLFLLLTVALISAHAQGISANPPAATEPTRPIGIIDFYGLDHLSADKLRGELTFKVGDSVTIGDHSFFEASKQRLLMVPGVSGTRVQVVCCTDGRPVVFVGIEEKNAPLMQFRPAPKGSIRLPGEVIRTGAEFDELWMKEVTSGNAEEDDSEGHMLFTDAAARPTQDRVMAIAGRDFRLLRRVLHDSADAEHRALAARLLGYAKDQQSVVPDLVYAMSDSSESVRNNAMRALSVFTKATKVKPARVPYKPFIVLLNSPDWTDRNKASGALMQMASTRDPLLLTMLREQALVSLVEMARWTDRDHALPAFLILGNLAGLDEKEVFEDWQRNDRERVIERALGR